MSVIPDIKEYKTELRAKYKAIRHEMNVSDKKKVDKMIVDKLFEMDCIKNTETIITYVSTPIEVDTHQLINKALTMGKKVAVPKCIAGTRFMDFYYISSINDLEPATFSVLEPRLDICEKAINLSKSVCIVPGLAFDVRGYRLGYGKGYYDRFLSSYMDIKIGLCYCSCTVTHLQNGRFDCPVDFVVTEKYIKRIKKEAADNERQSV